MSGAEDCFHIGVKGLIFDNLGNCLVLKRASNGNWDLPGGRMQIGEDQEDTLNRELQEEIGVAFEGKHLMMTPSAIRFNTPRGEVGMIFSLFVCEASSAFTPQLSEEHCEFGWYSPEDASEMLVVYPKAIQDVIRGGIQCFKYL
jgi:8-oxo-dGTP pyrophosphatase MutT (NUDIX family)